MLLPTRAYSNPAGFAYCPFAIALPIERVEAILHGMVEAFVFIGRFPRGDLRFARATFVESRRLPMKEGGNPP